MFMLTVLFLVFHVVSNVDGNLRDTAYGQRKDNGIQKFQELHILLHFIVYFFGSEYFSLK